MAPTLRSRIKSLLSSGLVQRRLCALAAGSVLLTFDDGPHPDITPAVLERLKRHRARAVFFVVGQRIARAPHLLRRIEHEGHLLGNHSFLHMRAKSLGFWGYRHDVSCCQTAIAKQMGSVPALFRPPFGELSPTTMLVARSLGLSPILWSLDTNDWRCRTSQDAEAVAERMLRVVQGREIMLLHDDHPGVLTILDRVLPVLQERGLDVEQGWATVSRPPLAA
jgi:peptidoglycan/xylan/chitin deacetylase (PgdA/CDA1 family)